MSGLYYNLIITEHPGFKISLLLLWKQHYVITYNSTVHTL
jgi:hypothetical protein